MTIRLLAAALLVSASAAASGQPSTDMVPVTIETSAGSIVVELDKAHAPATTANFLHYVDTHRFDGETIYRAMKNEDGGGLIQGGVRSDARKLFPGAKHEPTTETGLHHTAGTISLANNGPDTAHADFFILTSDMPSLDATADNPGFAAFGHVTKGMDVVKTILDSPTSPTKGAGAMKGQMLDPAVRIIKVTRNK